MLTSGFFRQYFFMDFLLIDFLSLFMDFLLQSYLGCVMRSHLFMHSRSGMSTGNRNNWKKKFPKKNSKKLHVVNKKIAYALIQKE